MAESQTISAEKLCALTGLTDRRHRQLATQGFFPPPIKSEYQMASAIRGLFRYYREMNHRRNETIAEKKEKKLDSENALLELDLAERRMRVVSVEEMASRLSPALAAMRQRILSSTLTESEQGELLEDLGRLLDDAIKRPIQSPDETPEADPVAAAEAYSQPVG